MIDYSVIDKSITYYEACGYKRIETPWMTSKPISQITAPEGATFFTIKEKNEVLVASGEQSFLSLYNKGQLPKGKFQTVTPCFRDDPASVLHCQSFIKNELIRTDDTSPKALMEMIQEAYRFFYTFFNTKKLNYIQTGQNAYDIVYNEMELGSYGIRSCDFLTWIYGTGVAEPRLSRVYGISQKKN